MSPQNTTRAYLLTTDFKPMTGGIAEHMHNLWDYVGRNRPVTVLSTVPADATAWPHSYEWQQLPPIPERRLGRRTGDTVGLVRKMNSAAFIWELRGHARAVVRQILTAEGKPEVFIGLWSLGSHFWCRELVAAGIGYKLFAYGMDIVAPLSGPWAKWRAQDFAEARQVIGCSTHTAELAKSRFPLRGSAIGIPPGVVPPNASDQGRQLCREVRERLDLGGAPILLTVGRLVARKGVDLVLRAIAELKPLDCQYVIAGNGPERASWQRLAGELGLQDRVRFLGAVDDVTKWALYELADVFVMPNRLLNGNDWEGFGIVFLEAALAGTPSIGGNNGGVPQAIENGVTGILVDPEEQGALGAALELLLTDKDLRKRMGSSARIRARHAFNWDAVAARFATTQGWND